KWFIAAGAVESGHMFVLGVLIVSSLLNIAYLLPVVARGYLLPPPGVAPGEKVPIKEAPFACVMGLSVTALLCLVLFFQAGAIEELLAGAVSQSQRSLAGGAF
ncbi:MAG: hypothetical protein ACR2PO_18790, partial [Methyloligellaceae bacterium]